MNTRIVLPQAVPTEQAPQGAELSGPVEVTLALQEPSFIDRVAYNAAPGLGWLTAFLGLAVFLPLSRNGRDAEPATDLSEGVARGAAKSRRLRVGVTVVSAGLTATFAANRWAASHLASAVGAGYEPADRLPLAVFSLPVLLVCAVVVTGRLQRSLAVQQEELDGLV